MPRFAGMIGLLMLNIDLIDHEKPQLRSGIITKDYRTLAA